ncbi:C13 family peptidase [Roseibacterium beibuensis]|uniref:C13 family peptidase n=1 Tax=[Roseibacterium] beibuensis TaxID=1193142 RepID=UPI00217D0E71|nr:C13 family peptidase [Roseibacterium beibuensis]MCS6624897.1 C13 family peptidase [Roseibacterium beibuensis]
MGRGFALLMLTWALAASGSACAQSPASRFEGWATAVIAADWRDSGGRPIEAFDNALRDVTRGFIEAGLPRDSLVDVSLRPNLADPVTAMEAVQAVAEATARAQRGCLLYFTSHGAPDSMVFGPDGELTPAAMAQLVRQWCGARPTVVIVSACYSGIFVNALAAPNRMVLTAASRERTSFGCSAEETWPWFDGCVIETLPSANDFLSLAAGTRACVARKEQAAGVALPSEPQLFVGAEMQLRLPTLRFERSP